MPDPKPLIPAATVLLVRDAPTLQVLMVERHYQIDFASGALVFPGGKTGPEDHDPAWAQALPTGLGVAGDALALRIAAVREVYEESGLLLARPVGAGPNAPLISPVLVKRPMAVRAEIARGKASFLEMILAEGFELALDALTPFAHWITPKGLPKRFDTHFFIAHAPQDQDAAHDGHEAVEACWVTPHDALAAAAEGRRKIIFPTRLNVQLLAQSKSAKEAIAAAKARPITTVEPLIAPNEAGVQTLTIPPDAGYGAVSAPLSDVT
jgi:8-oxo-dGTP pyrophosphatase MutT (NUDIX family)